jgi:hypothetical protein
MLPQPTQATTQELAWRLGKTTTFEYEAGPLNTQRPLPAVTVPSPVRPVDDSGQKEPRAVR